VLDEDWANDAVINVRDLIGAYVTAYVNDDGDIIAIKEVKSTFLVGEFDAAGTLAAGGLDGLVFDADKEYDVVLPAAPAVPFATVGFTNGETDATLTAVTTTDTYKIAVDVSGKKIKDVYSVSVWDLSNGLAFYFDEDMLEDDNLNGYDFKLDDNDEIDLGSFVLLGADSLDAIADDDVVYVYTAGGFITKIEVGTETVSGEVTKVNAASDTFTIDGKAYSEGAGYIGTDPAAGDEVKLVLDYAGDVYDVDAISVADTYAVVIKAVDGAAATATTFAETPQVELLLADGSSKVFDAKASSINDANVITAAHAWKSGPSEEMEPGSLIKYGLNADGVITSITPLTEVTGAAVTGVMEAGSKLSASGYYSGYKVKNDAVIFVYDGTFTVAGFFGANLDADDFSTTELSKILDTTSLRAFYTVNSSGLIDTMVIHSGAVVSDDVYGVAVANGTNNSDAGFYVDVLVDGVKESYNAIAAYSNRTLVHEIEFDTNGNVTLTPVVLGTNAVNGTAAPTGPATSFKLSINSNNVVAVDAGITGAGTFDVSSAAFTLASDVDVYVWDGTKYTIGKLSDLKSNLTAAEFFDLGASADRDGVVDLVLITKL
jgi:hypothetical protein